HYFDQVLGHRSFRIVVVIWPISRFRAVAIAAQVGCHHGEILSKTRSNFMPHHMGLRIAMQQQQRETISLFDQANSCPTGIDLSLLKALEHTYAPNRQTRTAGFLSSWNVIGLFLVVCSMPSCLYCITVLPVEPSDPNQPDKVSQKSPNVFPTPPQRK